MDAADSSGIRVTGTDGDGAQGTDVKVFLLERIMDERVVDGVHMFRVRWHGFTEADDTWEPTENIVDIAMIEQFRARRPLANVDAGDMHAGDPHTDVAADTDMCHGQGLGEDVKVFQVERIMDERVVDGVHMFRVRWHGFTEADDTWEPTESFVELKMIEEYRERRGGAQPIQQVSRRRGLPRCTSARTYAC